VVVGTFVRFDTNVREEYLDWVARRVRREGGENKIFLVAVFIIVGVGLRVKVNKTEAVPLQSVCCTMEVNYNPVENVSPSSAPCGSLITFHTAKTFNCAFLIQCRASITLGVTTLRGETKRERKSYGGMFSTKHANVPLLSTFILVKNVRGCSSSAHLTGDDGFVVFRKHKLQCQVAFFLRSRFVLFPN
jgi:hypothetical protein